MIIRLYRNYGVLGHEKQPVYSYMAHSEIYDIILVSLQKDAYKEIRRAEDGDLIICLKDGTCAALTDLLSTGKDGNPILSWYNGRAYKYEKLIVRRG